MKITYCLYTVLSAYLLLLPLELKGQEMYNTTYTANGLRDDSLLVNDPTRHVTRATMYGVGYTNVFDTYLSPQEYKGIELRITRESSRMTHKMKGNVMRQTLFQAYAGYTHNRVDNNNTFSSLANWNYSLHYLFRLSPQLTLTAGAAADLNGGFVYNLRNGNNPAQARAYISLDATGMAIYTTHIRRIPITMRYQITLPLAGVQFMPEYGESYYEIFSLGHAEGVVRFTSLHNQPSVRQLLSADFPVGKATLRLAYLADLQQGNLNHIKWHTYSHCFLVGIVKSFYLMK